jgi:hypothetical protein
MVRVASRSTLRLVSDEAVRRRLLDAAPRFAQVACDELVAVIVGEFEGTSYVKTIYLGFEVAGQMVAAAYPHPDGLEVALRLPEDHEAAGLIDATHLTWRTMPVAYEVREATQVPELLVLVREAVNRLRSGIDNV